MGPSRQIPLAAMATLMVILALVGWRMFQEPRWRFSVEELKLVAGRPQFSEGGMIGDEQVSVASAVWSRTRKPVALVIVDSRKEASETAYAFVRAEGGSVYTLRGAGQDAWVIVAKAKWTGDPHDFVLKISTTTP